MVNIINKNQPIHKIDRYGNEYWTLNDLLHREDGPSVKYYNGDKAWHLHGQLHRIDGPAVEYANGSKAWWYYGKYISCSSQEEFEKLIKFKWLW